MANNKDLIDQLYVYRTETRLLQEEFELLRDAEEALRAADKRIAELANGPERAEVKDLKSCIVWLVDNVDIDMQHGEPSIAWPGFELVGDMTAAQIVEAVKLAKEASDANRR